MKTGPPRGWFDRKAANTSTQRDSPFALKRSLLLQPCIGVVTGTGGRAQSACELRGESITGGSRAQWRVRKRIARRHASNGKCGSCIGYGALGCKREASLVCESP